MPNYPEETQSKHATVRLPKELLNAIEEFLQTDKAQKMGFLHITDVATTAVREFLRDQGYYTPPDRYINLNHDENGIKIFDIQQRKPIQIYIRPQGIWCEQCQKTTCEHIDYALTQPDIQTTIRKKRREGWNLPDT
ncbi:MAG: ribbon-helix-helix domain-containing protein [Candidatus Bathyarchaeota archaeon]|nr:ribbon-helix-helix domain-containing protein [Candidatus Bathyarchaeota archaeon]